MPIYYTEDRDLSLFDVINLAQCAKQRAELAAGKPDDRFSNEYWCAQMWASQAKSYRLVY